MSDAKLSNRARTVMWLVTIPLAALALLALLLAGNIVMQAIWRGPHFAASIAVGVAIYYLPMAFYMWAIWMIREALRVIAQGELFDRVVPRLLARVGMALFCGAVFKEVGAPLLAVISGHPHFQTFEPSGVTIGVVGASLALFAQLLRRATDIHEELGEFI